MDSIEVVTGLILTDRKLGDLAVSSLVRDACGRDKALELSSVKGDNSSADLAVLGVVGFKPRKIVVSGREKLSVYMCDLKKATTTARLLVDSRIFMLVVGNHISSVEGLLLLILQPMVSIDSTNGSLTLTVEKQSQLAVVGRCKFFALCGAEKRSKTALNGETNLCRIPIDSSKCRHCSYHSKPLAVAEQQDVATKKRPIDAILGAAGEHGVTSKAPIYRDAHNSNERELEENEQDPEDMAHALRHHAAAVGSLFGAAYGTADTGRGAATAGPADAKRILQRADATELLVAQRIVHNLAQESAARTVGASSLPSSSSTSSTATPGVAPLRQISALSQRVALQQQARSGNLRTNPANTASSSTPAHAKSTTTAAGMSVAANSGNPLAGAKYKLVGDSLINAATLSKNVQAISSGGTRNDQTSSGKQRVATFEELIGRNAAQSRPNTGGVGANTATNASNSTSGRPGSAPATAVEKVNFSRSVPPSIASGRPPGADAKNAPIPHKAASGAGNKSASSLDAQIADLLGRRSSHATEAVADWAEGFGKRMDVLAKREYAQTKAAEVHSIEIWAFRCGNCENRLTEQFPQLCHDNKHNVQKVQVIKRFFECGQCAKRESSLSARKDLGSKVVLPPEIRCLQCGAFRWRPCGQRGSGPLSVTAKDTRDITSGAQLAAGESGSKLILSASEWTRRGDSVTMAERVSRL